VELRRLFQPDKPAFWLVLVLNALSMVLVWLTQKYTFTLFASGLLIFFALGNAALGAFFTWKLLKTSAPGESGDG
jgi:hypothetical protein